MQASTRNDGAGVVNFVHNRLCVSGHPSRCTDEPIFHHRVAIMAFAIMAFAISNDPGPVRRRHDEDESAGQSQEQSEDLLEDDMAARAI